MKAALFAFTRRGCETARRILTALPEAHWQCFTLERLSEPSFGTLTPECYGQAFGTSDLLVFVGACGIAVRKIAPYVRDKRTDPAVVCVDEQGTFVISLLSGHIGGANGLTKTIAQAIGAVPVITTATDVNGKFSVDTWATENGCVIDDMKLAKAVSAAILERNVPFFSEIPIVGRLPDGLTPGNTGTLGICVSFQESAPFARTLRLIPRILHLGIGCRKGTPKETIAQAVDRVFRENHLDFRDDSFLSCKPALSKIFQKQLLEFGGFLVKLFKLRQIFRIDFPDFFLCVLFIATFLVAFRASDIFDFDFQYAGKFRKCAFEILFIFGRILF